jgi:hypothetical protein
MKRLRSIAVTLSVIIVGVAPRLAAQDCASAPLLGGRAAAGVSLSRSMDDERAAAASLTAGVGAQLRLSGTYRATRLEQVDRLRHEGRLEISRPVAVPTAMRAVSLCPLAGASLARLATERSGTQGRVTTREAWLGAELSHSLALRPALALTPFVQPMLLRRAIAWRSTETAWVVVDRPVTTTGQVWLGLSVATPRAAVIARARPSAGGEAGELALGVATRVGW